MLRILIMILLGLTTASAIAAPRQDWLNQNLSLSQRIGAAAEERATHFVIYDGSGMPLKYPGGDVPANKGVCTDEVIRTFRLIGVDLQQLVHEDMLRDFRAYPQKFGERAPNSDIDHRRVGNLQTFFERNAEVLPITDNGDDYLPGDVIVWDLDNFQLHIGMVTRRKSSDGKRPLVMHNIAHGPKINDQLFYFKILGHYRFDGHPKITGPIPSRTAWAPVVLKPDGFAEIIDAQPQN